MPCEGLTGAELEKCRNMKSSSGDFPFERILGGLALLFGVLLLWMPQMIVWIVGAFLILGGLVVLVTRRTFLLPAVMIVSGGAILMFPNLLGITMSIIMLIMGFVIAFQEPKSKMTQGVGIGIILIGLILFFFPLYLGVIIGFGMIIGGAIFLIGGGTKDIPYWHKMK